MRSVKQGVALVRNHRRFGTRENSNPHCDPGRFACHAVSNMVFYDQLTVTVVSGRNVMQT